MRSRSFLTLAIFLAMAVTVVGQCPGLIAFNVGLASGNAHRSNMFDIKCNDPSGVLIQGLEGSWTGTTDIQIWVVTSGGSHIGNETNPAAWTLLGSATGITGNGPGAATPTGIALNHFMNPGDQTGFYFESTNTAVSLHYTNGTGAGNVWASDASLDMIEGCGGETGFQCTFTPRVWNGIICYSVGGTPPTVEYQTNYAEASLTINGATGGSFGATVLNLDVEVDPMGNLLTPANATMSLQANGTSNPAYDVFLSANPLVPLSGGGLAVPLGAMTPEIVNLNVFAGFTSLNSGNPNDIALRQMPLQGFPGATGSSIVIPATYDDTNAPADYSVQAAVTDAAYANGFRLTQATEVHVGVTVVYPPYTVCPATAGGDLSPLTDDGTINQPLLGTFAFYGTAYTDINVNMNGNLTFVSGDTDFTNSEGEMLSDQPRIAPAWYDWSPNAQGTVRFSDDGISFQCEWFNVRAFGCAGQADQTATFCAQGTYATSFIQMRYGMFNSCTTINATVGISPGNGLSLPNNVDLWDDVLNTPNNNGPTAGANDALYESFELGAYTTAMDMWGDQVGTTNGNCIGVSNIGSCIFFAPTGATPGAGPYLQN